MKPLSQYNSTDINMLVNDRIDLDVQTAQRKQRHRLMACCAAAILVGALWGSDPLGVHVYAQTEEVR